MFEQARSLAAGAKIIVDSDGVRDGERVLKPSSPVILSCALSIEISLKLLAFHETGTAAKGHRLDAIFNGLPQQVRQRIELHVEAELGEEFVSGLTTELQKHSDIFVAWRYAYESGSGLECSPSFLYSFAHCLSIFVEKNYLFERNDNGWLVLDA